MKRRKLGPVSEIIEHWNHVRRVHPFSGPQLRRCIQYFFHLRAIDVALVQGNDLPDDPSSDSDTGPQSNQRSGRRGARDARRTERRQRRTARRAGRGSEDDKWQLIVSYRPARPQSPYGAAEGQPFYAGNQSPYDPRAQSPYDPAGAQFGPTGAQYGAPSPLRVFGRIQPAAGSDSARLSKVS